MDCYTNLTKLQATEHTRKSSYPDFFALYFFPLNASSQWKEARIMNESTLTLRNPPRTVFLVKQNATKETISTSAPIYQSTPANVLVYYTIH